LLTGLAGGAAFVVGDVAFGGDVPTADVAGRGDVAGRVDAAVDLGRSAGCVADADDGTTRVGAAASA